MQVGNQLFCLLVQRHGTHRPAFVYVGRDLLQQRLLPPRLLVAASGGLDHLLQGAVQGLLIGQAQLGVDHFYIRQGVDLARHVHDVFVLEAAHHLGNGVGLAYVGQELVAQPLALGGALHQAGDIHELHMRGYDLFGFDDGGDLLKPRVGHGHHAYIGINGAEGVVLGAYAGVGQRVKESGLAHVGQTDDAAFETHYRSNRL